MKTNDKKYMKKAIAAAKESAENGDYPIGAVVVKDGEVIATGYETLKSENDPVNGHAEIAAIRKACKALGEPYLIDCTLYSTHEPCPMCASASFWAKVFRIVFSVSRENMIAHMNEVAKEADEDFSWRQIDISCESIINSGQGFELIKIESGVLRDEGLKLFDLA